MKGVAEARLVRALIHILHLVQRKAVGCEKCTRLDEQWGGMESQGGVGWGRVDGNGTIAWEYSL